MLLLEPMLGHVGARELHYLLLGSLSLPWKPFNPSARIDQTLNAHKLHGPENWLCMHVSV